MSYTADAVKNMQAFVNRLRGKGWNRMDVLRCYPFVSTHRALRSRVEKVITVGAPALTDDQLNGLYSCLFTGKDFVKISAELGIDESEVENLGKVIGRLFKLVDKGITYATFAKINKAFSDGVTVYRVCERYDLSRDLVYAYYNEVYDARPSEFYQE